MSKTPELLPCPFCGAEGVIKTHGAPYRKIRGLQYYRTKVGCSLCTGAVSQAAATKELSATYAIDKWNNRTQPKAKPLTVDALMEMEGTDGR